MSQTAYLSFDSKAIMACLPHRYPFILIDKVVKLIPDESIIAIKNVTINEPFFQGHFPNDPIMPGVFIVEAMAQTTGILAAYTEQALPSQSGQYILAAIDHVKFKKPVIPGDQLHIMATMIWKRSSFVKCHVVAQVDNHIVCVADITGAKRPYK